MKGIRFSWKDFWKDLGTRRWMFLLAAGLLIVVVFVPVGERKENGQGETDSGMEEKDQTGGGINDYEKKLEKRLTELLSQVEGAGRVEVMVTLKTTSEQMVLSDYSRQKNLVRETDSQGGVRNNSDVSEKRETVLTGGSASQQPFVTGEVMPQVEGVVVACEGGDRASVRAEISAAVQALFDIEVHKIKVCKMASQ